MFKQCSNVSIGDHVPCMRPALEDAHMGKATRLGIRHDANGDDRRGQLITGRPVRPRGLPCSCTDAWP
jgi:hypothetical protein